MRFLFYPGRARGGNFFFPGSHNGPHPAAEMFAADDENDRVIIARNEVWMIVAF